MHVRLQTWFPFSVQVYVNGHSWLERQMTKWKMGLVQRDNAFLRIDNSEKAQRPADEFCRLPWIKLLDRWARVVNPLLKEPMFRSYGYYWTTTQVEYSTDVLVKSRDKVAGLYPRLMDHATLNFSAADILTFLGRYTGATTISAGTLALGAAGSFASSPTITVGDVGSSGAVLDIAAKTGTFAFTSGQTVGGIGTIKMGAGDTAQFAGILAPGNSPGILTIDGGTALLSGTTQIEFFGAARGTGYDAIDLINSAVIDYGNGVLAAWAARRAGSGDLGLRAAKPPN
jgi:hypothetical protein